MREGHDDPVSGPHEARQLVLGLGEAARGNCGTLRLEGVGLGLREGIELGDPVEPRRCEALLLRDLPHLVRLPHEVGRTPDRRDEVVRHRGRPFVLVLASEVGLDKVGAALSRRIDHRVVGRMQRPLRERREGPDLLDLVAEELDTERLSTGRGEDVDDPAPHGELPALLDPVDPLVAGQREPLREAVDTGLVAHSELERSRSRVERR